MSRASIFRGNLECAWKMTCTSLRTAPSYSRHKAHRSSIRSGASWPGEKRDGHSLAAVVVQKHLPTPCRKTVHSIEARRGALRGGKGTRSHFPEGPIYQMVALSGMDIPITSRRRPQASNLKLKLKTSIRLQANILY